MSGRRAFLETTLKDRLVDTHRHLQALELAVVAFPGGFGPPEFERAWVGDPGQLLTVYPIQAGYENVINGCVKVAQELCELNGWTPLNLERKSIEAFKHLHENGIIGPKTRTALKDAYERRGEIRHDYVGAAAREVHAATLAVLEHAPLLLQDVALHLKQRA